MKRIISILLAFILGLSLLPVSAFATESDKRAEEYEEATRYFVANYDKDFDKYYAGRSNEVITKSQAAMLMSYWQLGARSAAAIWGNPAPYSDVSVSYWASGYIAYCKQAGLMQADADGKFNPTREMTVAEFAKQILQCIRDNTSLYSGVNWVEEVYADAKAYKLLPTNAQKNAKVTYGDAIYMIFRADVYNDKATAKVEPTYAPEDDSYLDKMQNFVDSNEYTDGQFSDVSNSSWYADSVAAAYRKGLVKGASETQFNPNGNMTIAEAITLAARLRSIYETGKAEFEQSDPWYQTYVDYATENGIIAEGDYSDYTKAATRAQFACIMAKALPEEALSAINYVPFGQIPDITLSETYSNAVYMLYNAGILTGNDSYGTFTPDSTITRSAVATIVTRMADMSLRKQFVLEDKPVEVTGISLDQTSLTLYSGMLSSLTAYVWPENATNRYVTWTSSNPKVATVSYVGVVSAISEGTTVITATTSNGKSANCTVTVKVITDKSLAQAAYNELCRQVKFPDTLKIHNVWAYDLKEYRKIELDYSAENSYGQRVRKFFVATFLQDGTIYVTDSKDSSPHRSSGFLGTNLRELSVKDIKQAT